MFSDGTVEAEKPTGEPFDVEGVRKILADAVDCGARQVLLKVRSAVQAHQKTRPTDDQTLLVLRAI